MLASSMFFGGWSEAAVAWSYVQYRWGIRGMEVPIAVLQQISKQGELLALLPVQVLLLLLLTPPQSLSYCQVCGIMNL